MNSNPHFKALSQLLLLGACSLLLMSATPSRAASPPAAHAAEPAPLLNVAGAALQSWPLPDALIIAGHPLASGRVLSKSADGRKVRGIWSSTPGRFRWNWDYDETVVVLSGRATVELDGGRRMELGPGDMAFFERGQQSVWTIHETLRKGFHADSPVPLPF